MKQFAKILKFELKNYLTNKIFVGVTVFLVAAIAVVMSFPRILDVIGSGESTPEGTAGEASGVIGEGEDSGLPIMLIAGDMDEDEEMIREAFTYAFSDHVIKVSDANRKDIEEQIASGNVECAFVFDHVNSYTYYVNNLTMYDSNTMIADEVLQNVYQMSAMIKLGLSPEEASLVLNVPIAHDIVNLGKDQFQNFFYTYIMIFALYMVILLYGQMVATNVATEKSSRAMELLITSAKPTSMMFGKVIASCLAGLMQLIAVFGSALIFFHFNKGYWGDNPIITSIFDMPLELFGYMLVFFVLGFFVYAFMYGAIGSTASKLEDINSSVMPITMLFIIAFFVVMFSLAGGSVDSLLMKVCSFIPFTSPMAMFTRIAMSVVPLYQIVISIIILIISVIGIGVLSAKIYRVGVLLYGTPPKIRAIIKAIKEA